MAISVDSGNTSVTGNVSVTTTTTLAAPSATQTIVTAKATGVATGSTVYTVTAGKTFYCTGIVAALTGSGVSAGTIGGTIQYSCAAANTPCVLSGGILASFSAGTAITVATGSAGNNVCIWGFEQ